MTAYELIEKLKTFPESTPVVLVSQGLERDVRGTLGKSIHEVHSAEASAHRRLKHSGEWVADTMLPDAELVPVVLLS
jgi:hypothetical protein